VADLAVAVALGGDAARDVAVLRAQPGVFGRVASDPTVSRLNWALPNPGRALGRCASTPAVLNRLIIKPARRLAAPFA
jgi:hypothetical protein